MMECCICEISSTFDESGRKRKERQLPLQKRPEVLLLPFQNTFNTICIRCNSANDSLIKEQAVKTFTPSDLMKHIKLGKTDMAKLICMTLPIGAGVHYHDEADSNNTALHLCATYGYWHLANFLLKRRRKRPGVPGRIAEEADPSYLHDKEDTVHDRRRNKLPEDLELLDALDKYGRTPLHLACMKERRTDLCRLFAEEGADINQYANGSTPLMFACASGQHKVVKLLHQLGASLDKRTGTGGKTALMKCALLGELVSCKTLLKLGARLDIVDHEGKSALDHAVKRRLLDPKYEDLVSLIHQQLQQSAVAIAGQTTDTTLSTSTTHSTKQRHSSCVRAVSMAKAKKYGYAARQRKRAAAKWQEHWDDLAEAPYWCHCDTNEATWDCPSGVEPTLYNPIEEAKHRRSSDDSDQENEEENEEIPYDPTVRRLKPKRTFPTRKERQAKLLENMKEEYRAYNQQAQKTVQAIANGSFNVATKEEQGGTDISTCGRYYQNLPDRTVHKRRVPRPMNPHVYYDDNGFMTVNKNQAEHLYTSWEDPGIDFPLIAPAEDVDMPLHVWPGNYKRSGMGGNTGDIGKVVQEEEDYIDRRKLHLYEYRHLPLAQQARDHFTTCRREKNRSDPGSYALFVGGVVKKT